MSMGYYNYSLGGLLSWILILLAKLFMILLVVVVVLGIAAWIRETFFKNNNSKLQKTLGNDPILKSAVVVTLVILGIVIVAVLFNSFMMQPGLGMSFNTGRLRGGFYYGYSPAFSIVGLLALLIKILTFILILSLVLAAVVYLKNQYESGNLNFFDNQNKSNDIILDETQNTPNNSGFKTTKPTGPSDIPGFKK